MRQPDIANRSNQHGPAIPAPPARELQRSAARRPDGVEWPTVIVIVAVYGGWVALTRWHAALPVLLQALCGAWLVAWHGSLQHETIHGHPTRRGFINTAIGFVPLSLWLPYSLYRRGHLAHHASPRITDPLDDPESRYLGSHAAPWRWVAIAQATLIGRLLLGPAFAVLALARDEGIRLGVDPRAVVRDWGAHLIAVAAIVAWLEWTQFGVLRYVLLCVYPGTALTLLRSFAEHRAEIPGASRAATVERGGILGLLYLNNHLHTAHHDRPGLAWYRLPAHQRSNAARLTAQAGRSYRNYGEIIRRFAWRPHDAIVHPDAADRA